MKLPITLTAILTFTAVAVAQSITGFGTGQFTFDSGSSIVNNTTPGPNSFTVRMADQGGQLAGLITPTVNIVGNSGALSLTATVTENPGSNFSLELYDNNVFATYSGSWGSFVTGASSTAMLTLVSAPGFNFANVTGVQFSTGGTNGPFVTVTLDQLTAVPEPSTYAVIAGAMAMSVAALRRRHKRSRPSRPCSP